MFLGSSRVHAFKKMQFDFPVPTATFHPRTFTCHVQVMIMHRKLCMIPPFCPLACEDVVTHITMPTFQDENPHWKPAPSGTQFFKKSKKRSEARFGPLLMSSGRLVLFSGESEHFFFGRKCGSENKKKILKNSNGWNI